LSQRQHLREAMIEATSGSLCATSPPVANPITELIEQARLAALAFAEFSEGLFRPTVRLGVTGLSRAGKTVFITALVHGLLRGGRFPVFEPFASGRIAAARLTPQPDDAVPRFDYERHVQALVTDREWPDSTRQISELRVVIDYQSARGAMRTLTLDIVDYPGEWLLDLPLLEKTYEDWSAEALEQSRAPTRKAHASPWHAQLATLDPFAPADENLAIATARRFTEYLHACRGDRHTLGLLPPGRFLMPGDLAGSPALTFAPLDLPSGGDAPGGSLWAMMRRRYDAYREVVVRPFFRDHFARLDRQIVLVDALAALDAGLQSVRDLQEALVAILDCFRVGRGSLWNTLFRPSADRILFAATKADLLHHTAHDRLEAILKRMTVRAIERAGSAGAEVEVVALAAVRATREALVRRDAETLPSIIGTVAMGEAAAGRTFDGRTEVALFPGDLPNDVSALFDADHEALRRPAATDDLRFVRFRPPALELGPDGIPELPHIRLDRAMQFLFGDRMR
jgi:predicted YcjX-like family ATPase